MTQKLIQIVRYCFPLSFLLLALVLITATPSFAQKKRDGVCKCMNGDCAEPETGSGVCSEISKEKSCNGECQWGGSANPGVCKWWKCCKVKCKLNGANWGFYRKSDCGTGGNSDGTGEQCDNPESDGGKYCGDDADKFCVQYEVTDNNGVNKEYPDIASLYAAADKKKCA